jgi:DNA polymerase I-like protein with 3'-5' exonuclease and polymerase domains
MFFDDEPLALRKHARIRQAPPVPETGWRKPEGFPNLKGNVAALSFDCETKELDFDNGPGWGRKQGHIVGVSVAARDRLGNQGAWYFPVRHEVGGEDNLDARNVFGWVGELLDTPEVPKVGANLTYDIGWLGEEGVKVTGPLNEVQFAEALIDSEAFVALDILGHKYLRRGKTTNAMYEWIKQAYPNTPHDKLRKDIYRTPPKLVGPYAIDDADMPLGILDKQWPILVAEGLDYVYRLECDLIPLIIRMRREGVTVDLAHAQMMLEQLKAETVELFKRVYYEFGYNLTATDSGQLGKLFDHVGLSYPRNAPTDRNPSGSPQIRKEWLAALTHPLGDLLNEIREHEKICGTFLQSYLLDKSIPIPGSNSLATLHPQFHQMKGDENGTVVGRFSSSDPNLQNIPSRTKLGKRVREAFVKSPGHSHWLKFDYSQIHYRILAHNAVDDPKGPYGAADALRERYQNDPKTDYHLDVYMKVAPLLGWSTTDEEVIKVKRRPIKNVNFGLLYGQGKDALSYKSGLSGKQADDFFTAYHTGAPYVKPTMAMIAAEVQQFGYVTTLLGRRIRFPLWEPLTKDWDNPVTPLPFESAIREWGSAIKRAFDYRGVNYKFQGSEPDIMKKGMRDCLNSGVFDYTGVPRLTVHDELDFSVRDDSPAMREAFEFIRTTMQNSIKLRVPVYVDKSTGPSWGKAD